MHVELVEHAQAEVHERGVDGGGHVPAGLERTAA